MVYEILTYVFGLALIIVTYLYVNYRYQMNRLSDTNSRVQADEDIYRYTDEKFKDVYDQLHEIRSEING